MERASELGLRVDVQSYETVWTEIRARPECRAPQPLRRRWWQPYRCGVLGKSRLGMPRDRPGLSGVAISRIP